MKNLLLALTLPFIAILFTAFQPSPIGNGATIKWYTWEEAIELNKENPKKIFIDVYTDWCHWCKVMDKNTFTDADVIEYMNEHFYAVKFNAEQREDVQFSDHTFKFIAQGRRGVHELAYALLDGRLSYPSVVYLNEKLERITVSPGYKKPDQIINELKFVGEEHYTNKTWQEYTTGQ